MVVGILGGGQLARMLAIAGYPLGLDFVVQCPVADACAGPLGQHLQAGFDDETALAELASRVDVITYEFENVPKQTAEFLAARKPVYPPVAALATAQDRLFEKTMFRELGIATPAFAPVDSMDELVAAVEDIGLPCVVKTRTQGYDGKGQAVLKSSEDIVTAWNALGSVPLIVEAFVPFQREISIIAVRGRDGQAVFYPVSENTHRNGILHLSVSKPGDPMQARAEDYVRRLLDRLEYVGTVALELFQVGDEILANEFAPRVHNSGHWTIEGAVTSQFENHMRAVAGMPLGSTAAKGCAAMLNFIGTLPPNEAVLEQPNVHLHLYGKEPKPGRKVGHATLQVDDPAEFEVQLEKMLALVD